MSDKVKEFVKTHSKPKTFTEGYEDGIGYAIQTILQAELNLKNNIYNRTALTALRNIREQLEDWVEKHPEWYCDKVQKRIEVDLSTRMMNPKDGSSTFGCLWCPVSQEDDWPPSTTKTPPANRLVCEVRDKEVLGNETPDWCPLRNGGSVLIVAKESKE